MEKEVDREKAVRNLREEYETTKREYGLMKRLMERMYATIEEQLVSVRAAKGFQKVSKGKKPRRNREVSSGSGSQGRKVDIKGKNQVGQSKPARKIKGISMLEHGSAKAKSS